MRRRGSGFTIVEVLVCLGILGVLFGMVFALMGPARERARRANCMSRLHQIGIAINLYRQDYGRAEYGTSESMGLPPRLWTLAPPLAGGRGYVSSEADLQCCRAAAAPAYVGGKRIAPFFGYVILDPLLERNHPQVPEFRKIVRERGPDYPLVLDNWHDDHPLDRPPGLAPPFRMILRLDGRVTSGYSAYQVGEWEL